MSTLLLEKDLRSSEADSEVRTLARARTLTILVRMNPSRKRQVIQFLYEADLIRGVEGRQPIMSLREANLNDAQGATGKQLEDMAKTLEGATMPDGSKHP